MVYGSQARMVATFWPFSGDAAVRVSCSCTASDTRPTPIDAGPGSGPSAGTGARRRARRLGPSAQACAATPGCKPGRCRPDARYSFHHGPLGGGHSHYQPPSEQSRGTPFSSSAAPSQLLPIAETWRTSNGTPGLALHRWAGDKTVAAAGDARRALHAAMAEPSCGLMIDLRGNTGGNLWPMLFGVSPLLPQGKIGGFQKRSGEHADILNLPTGNRSAGSGCCRALRSLRRPICRATLRFCRTGRLPAPDEILLILLQDAGPMCATLVSRRGDFLRQIHLSR